MVGRIVDDLPKARLVSNGALHSDEPLNSYLPLISERFMFMTRMCFLRSDGWTVCSGDVSGAYYCTPGEGFIRLPDEWPLSAEPFKPGEIVRLKCAIPGDSLSSGLFLEKIGELLHEGGYLTITGAVRGNSDSLLINFSDDFVAVVRNDDVRRHLESTINKQYKIEFQPLHPDRWVSLEFSFDSRGYLTLHTRSTAMNYLVESVKFTLDSYDKLNIGAERHSDLKLVSSARGWVGRLNYLASSNPYFRYPVSFLGSAMLYDPEGVIHICKGLINAYVLHPFELLFAPISPSYVAIYSDASHSLKNLRGHAGVWVQLQVSGEAEERHNVVGFSSERLALMYDSVFAAELKAATIAILYFLSLKDSLFALYGYLKPVLFIDNKAAVLSLNNNKDPHPFNSDAVDFLRQQIKAYDIEVLWVCSAGNHADCLTKPQKWY